MNPRLQQWIKEAIEIVALPWSPFTSDSHSRLFLDRCLQIAETNRKGWTDQQKQSIQIFRRIRQGSAQAIEDYWSYYVDKNSTVYRLGGWGAILKQTQTVKGYMVTNLNNGRHANVSKQKTQLIHRLVAQSHIDNPDPAKLVDVHHLDNDRGNNESYNLMWTSHAANMRLKEVKDYVPPERICAYCGEIAPPS